MHLLALLGPFTDPNTLLCTSTSQIPTLSYTWSLKTVCFRAEPPRMGHYRKYPSPREFKPCLCVVFLDKTLYSTLSISFLSSLSSLRPQLFKRSLFFVDHFFARKQWLGSALQNIAGNHHANWRTKQPQYLFRQTHFGEKLEKLEIWLILSHLAEIRTLTLKNIG